MGPNTPSNSGAQFQDDVDKLFYPHDDDEEEQEESGDKNTEDT